MNIDLGELRKRLDQLTAGNQLRDPRPLVNELLATSLPAFERDLRALQRGLQSWSPPPASAEAPVSQGPDASALIMAGEQKYTEIRVPVLAIYADPHDGAKDDPGTDAQAKALESGISGRSASSLALPHANHFVFTSNEADVLREVNAFIAILP